MKKFYPILLCGFAILIGCNPDIQPDFSYSPISPKAGETVTFTNTTTEGEYWNWTFGDGGTATTKSPIKIYKKPGIYDVTLRVDSNDHYITTKQITIYDTIPSIYTETTDIYYYEPFTLSVLVYNPFSYDITYEWHFSDNAISTDIINNIATTETVTLYFSDYGKREDISLKISIGDSIYNISASFYINDVKSRSLLMAEPNGNILRQRIYENGTEQHTVLAVSAGRKPNNIKALNNKLYIFNADTLASSAIQVIDLSNNSTDILISQSTNIAQGGFFNGYAKGNYVYWTDNQNFIYRSIITTRNALFTWAGSNQKNNPYYVTDATTLGITTEQLSGGIAYYDGTYFIAKQGTGKGIVRFMDNAAHTLLEPILTNFPIQAFEIDELNLKIYFSVPASDTNKGLWVCNIDGSKPVLISELCTTGLAIDNQSDKVYWSTGNSVMCCQLTKSINNIVSQETINIFTDNIRVTGLAIDKVTR